MSLTQLPREMVVAIAAHLDARDVTACSAVSVSWRAAFNVDCIWKTLCSFSPDYFSEHINRIKPCFETPFVEGVQLEPLCEWRVTFLKEIYMMKNWKSAHFYSDEVEIETNACLYAMDAIDMYQNHWMFLCCSSKRGLKLQVWNIKGTPFLQISTNMCNIFKNVYETIENNVVNFKLHLSGDKLLFLYDNLVTVLSFTYPYTKLNFLYNFSVVHTAPFFTPRRISHLAEGNLCEIAIFGSHLFAVSYSARDRVQHFSPSVHVWDLDAALKVKDHCVFEPRSQDTNIYSPILFLTSDNSQNLVITRTFDGSLNTSTRIRVFDKRNCEYTKFYIQLKGPVIWTAVAKQILAVCELINPLERECVFYFYDIDSATCLLKTSSYNIYNPEKISCSKSKFAFIDIDSNITVYDIGSQQACTTSLHPSRNRLKAVTLINDHLLLLENKYKGTNRSFQNILITSYEIWDLKRRKKPLRLDQCYRSINRTKFTHVKNLSIPPKLITIVQPLYRSLTVCVNSFW